MPLQMSLLVIIVSNVHLLESLVYLLCLPSVILFTLYFTILRMTSYQIVINASTNVTTSNNCKQCSFVGKFGVLIVPTVCNTVHTLFYNSADDKLSDRNKCLYKCHY